MIATKHGLGALRIIGSVKAYAKHREVSYDDIRALIGVLSVDLGASKAVLTTTSHFPANVEKEPSIAPLLPSRLELLGAEELREWFDKLVLRK